MAGQELTGSEIRELLGALDAELWSQGKAATIFIVGGAAMALAYNIDRATSDVDGTFQPRDVVLSAAAAVASRRPGLDPSWLSDGVSQMMPPTPDDHPRSERIGPALTISIASPEYVLAMKAMVTRHGQGDVDDAVTLCKLLGVANQDQLESVVARYFPGRQFGVACGGSFSRPVQSLVGDPSRQSLTDI